MWLPEVAHGHISLMILRNLSRNWSDQFQAFLKLPFSIKELQAVFVAHLRQMAITKPASGPSQEIFAQRDIVNFAWPISRIFVQLRWNGFSIRNPVPNIFGMEPLMVNLVFFRNVASQ